MALPTFSSVSPPVGHTAGRVVVEVLGSNFQLPVVASSGPVPGPVPTTVRVLFGTEPAEKVEVVTTGRLFVTTPIHDPGNVSLTIQNLAPDGSVIPGESVTSPGSVYSFARPTLTGEPANASDLQRLVETLVLEMRRQILPAVMVSQNTDYDPETGAEIAVIDVATFPHLVLLGPSLKQNRFYSLNDPPEVEDGAGGFVERKVPITVDVEFTIVGVSNRKMEMLNLMHVTTNFFRDNTELRMNRSATNPAFGRNDYELDLTEDGGLASAGKENNSNIHSFTGRCVIRGFDIESVSGIVSQEISGTGVSAATVNAKGFITDEQGAVLDPVEQLGVASPAVVMSQGGQSISPQNKSSRPLVVRAILSPGD